MTVAAPDKPLPTIDDLNRPFWEAARAGELRMQRCDDCAHIRFPVMERCPRCLCSTVTWVALSGRGEVYAVIVYHRAFSPAFAPDTPYNVVLVQLDEGPRMYGNVVGSANDDIHVGDRLVVSFDQVTDEIVVPRFRLDPESTPTATGPPA
jgi:uncharacterized OB-fold protein